jgi:hypothetical protein
MSKGWLLAAVLALSSSPTSPKETPSVAPPRLVVLGRYAVPSEMSPTDLRWASKDSIYLADANEGVSELRLQPGLPVIRKATGTAKEMGSVGIVHLATSSETMVFSHVGVFLGWQPIDASASGSRPKRKEKSGHYQDVDVRGDEVILLGFPDLKTYMDRPAGSGAGLIWKSSLSDGLKTWELIYTSDAVARKGGTLSNWLFLGSIRFLKDGKFVVAPNFEPGVLLFNASGSLRRTWTPEEIWGEGGSAEVPDQDSRKLKSVAASRHLIEEVLPLAEGPAIVVRDSGGSGTRWRLGVLGDEIAWYDIPVSGVDRIARLRGDVDEHGRIVLVGAQRELYEEARLSKSEVIVLSLPE